jgi:hypothetical protein
MIVELCDAEYPRTEQSPDRDRPRSGLREQATVLRYQRPTMLDGAGVNEAVRRIAGKGRGEGGGRVGDRRGDADRTYLRGQPSQPRANRDRQDDAFVLGEPGQLVPRDIGDD